MECIEEYKWYVIGAGTTATVSVMINLYVLLRCVCKKTNRERTQTIELASLHNGDEMENYVLNIGDKRASSRGLPQWVINEYKQQSSVPSVLSP